MIESRDKFNEHDLVVLKHGIPGSSLGQGDIGAIVGIYADQEGFEVEFVTAEGRTIDVLTLERQDIRPFVGDEILHSRSLEAA